MKGIPKGDASSAGSASGANGANGKAPIAATDWDALVASGITRIEALAGQDWTDFNDHDPGVTLLHALAYGLTDLGYRAEQPIVDLLTGPDGRLDGHGGCLYPPEHIFPCAPVTLLDLRKRLLDELPGLRNVWIDRLPSDDPLLTGRYRVWLLPAADARADAAAIAQLLDSAARSLSSMRALGEVFDEVGLFSSVTLSLTLHAALSAEHTQEEALREAQAAVAAALAPPISFAPRTGPAAAALPPDLLYEGPWLAHGTLPDEELWAPRQSAEIEDLVRTALEHAGCFDEISSLEIRFSPAPPAAALPPCDFTWNAYAAANAFVFDERPYVPATPVGDSSEAASRSPAAEVRGPLATSTGGAFLAVASYQAVQDSLPPSYGLEKNGLPPDASPQRLAEVQQLRGYLFVFEQLLANRFAQLAHARELLTWRDGPSHVWQSLEGQTGADEVLLGAGASAKASSGTRTAGAAAGGIRGGASESRAKDSPYAAGLAAVAASWNQVYGQKEAVADHLLSRFAEAFPALDWQNFETLAQKQRLLASYPDLSENRNLGLDVARARRAGSLDPDNVSSLERKANVMLAAGPRQPLLAYSGDEAKVLAQSAAAGYQLYFGRSWYLVEHQLFLDGCLQGPQRAPSDRRRRGTARAPKAFFAGRISHVLTNWTFGELRPEFQSYVETFLRDAAPAHLLPRFLWRSPAQMEEFAGRLAAWYREGLPPLVVEEQEGDHLWVRCTGSAWQVVRALLPESGDEGDDDGHDDRRAEGRIEERIEQLAERVDEALAHLLDEEPER